MAIRTHRVQVPPGGFKLLRGTSTGLSENIQATRLVVTCDGPSRSHIIVRATEAPFLVQVAELQRFAGSPRPRAGASAGIFAALKIRPSRPSTRPQPGISMRIAFTIAVALFSAAVLAATESTQFRVEVQVLPECSVSTCTSTRNCVLSVAARTAALNSATAIVNAIRMEIPGWGLVDGRDGRILSAAKIPALAPARGLGEPANLCNSATCTRKGASVARTMMCDLDGPSHVTTSRVA